jgi:hypothetical protein
VAASGADPPARTAVRRLFLWALAFVYLDAFLSLLVQVRGLIGEHGILPLGELIGYARARVAAPRVYWLLPTVFWVDGSDAALRAVCAGGAALALVLATEAATAPVLLLLWAGYLSLASVGQIFLGYQWDALLLETGLLALLLAPWTIRPAAARAAAVPAPAVWLFRFLVFRLTFGSGMVKLLSGDPRWRDLTALQVHYETQPLPTWIGWYVHQLPPLAHVTAAGMMFFVELVVPFFVFGPRLLRRGAFLALVGLQVVIGLTGNYGFYNLLTIALCLMVLDDADLPAALRQRLSAPAVRPSPAARWVRGTAAAVLGLLALVTFLDGLRARVPWPQPIRELQRAAAPLESVNSYGLFAVMTTARPEIIIEGSRDGVAWQPYEFRWKAGDVHRRPAFVAPHQPRLDWQMWFAALGTCDDNPWLLRLLDRLQQGEPAVTRLLARDPFAGAPPAFLRTVVYDYHFTTLAERRAQGAWWRREEVGPYCPTVSP